MKRPTLGRPTSRVDGTQAIEMVVAMTQAPQELGSKNLSRNDVTKEEKGNRVRECKKEKKI